MSKRPLLLLLLLALVISGIVLMRACQDMTPSGPATSSTIPPTGRLDDRAASAQADADARARALAERRGAAMYAAVATLHRYIAALGGDDRAKADAFWAGKRPPAETGEADLRNLTDLRALRSNNGTPKALDDEGIPNALEIPIELRVSQEGKPLQRYHGWYRMRRAVADGGWEITSASIAAVAR